MSLFDDHIDEGYKMAIHGGFLLLSLELLHYNMNVYRRRGTKWHLWTTLAYGGIAALELFQMSRHLKDMRNVHDVK